MPKRPRWDQDGATPEGHALLEELASNLYPKGMDTKQGQETQRRKKIVGFWEEHGDKAAKDAFGVSRSTLFRWKRDAVPKSRAHRGGYEKRTVPASLEAEIFRLRTEHPKLGKEKLAPLLKGFCEEAGLTVLAEPTVGRVLRQLREAGRLPSGGTRLRMSGKTGKLLEKPFKPKAKKLRRDGYVPVLAGDLLQVDGVVKYANGIRRYAFTAVDLVSRWAFSRTYSSQSSRNGADFLRRLVQAAPFKIQRIQTDNGSEFMKEFGDAVEIEKLVRFFNWVRQPKYQGWVERFNRSIQEEFLDWKLDSLAGSLADFNLQLEAWLKFYNGQRVHRSLGTPCHRLTPLAYLALAGQCQTG